MSVATSWVQWFRPLKAEEETPAETKRVKFAKKVMFRAIEHANKGRSCQDRSVGRINRLGNTKTSSLTKFEWDKTTGKKARWSDMVDTVEEQTGRREDGKQKDGKQRKE